MENLERNLLKGNMNHSLKMVIAGLERWLSRQGTGKILAPNTYTVGMGRRVHNYLQSSSRVSHTLTHTQVNKISNQKEMFQWRPWHGSEHQETIPEAEAEGSLEFIHSRMAWTGICIYVTYAFMVIHQQ